jgi:maleate isomerase
MLTPSSNTVLEPYVSAILHPLLPAVTAHFQRFTVQSIGLDDAAMDQFADTTIVAAAETLADARPDVIAWAGTSGSWRGFDLDRALCRAITERTGVPATTSVQAINTILDRTRPQRVGLVTPYVGDVQAKIIDNYAAAGHTVHAECHLDDPGNFSFAEYSTEVVAQLIREVVADGCDAVVVLCTNFRGAACAAQIELETGVPIYDSVSATVWQCLALTGHRPSVIEGWGGLFGDPRLSDACEELHGP